MSVNSAQISHCQCSKGSKCIRCPCLIVFNGTQINTCTSACKCGSKCPSKSKKPNSTCTLSTAIKTGLMPYLVAKNAGLLAKCPEFEKIQKEMENIDSNDLSMYQFNSLNFKLIV